MMRVGIGSGPVMAKWVMPVCYAGSCVVEVRRAMSANLRWHSEEVPDSHRPSEDCARRAVDTVNMSAS